VCASQGQASLSSMLCMPDPVFYERFPSTYKRPPAYNISFADIAARAAGAPVLRPTALPAAGRERRAPREESDIQRAAGVALRARAARAPAVAAGGTELDSEGLAGQSTATEEEEEEQTKLDLRSGRWSGARAGAVPGRAARRGRRADSS
jgi:hypothetical protein